MAFNDPGSPGNPKKKTAGKTSSDRFSDALLQSLFLQASRVQGAGGLGMLAGHLSGPGPSLGSVMAFQQMGEAAEKMGVSIGSAGFLYEKLNTTVADNAKTAKGTADVTELLGARVHGLGFEAGQATTQVENLTGAIEKLSKAEKIKINDQVISQQLAKSIQKDIEEVTGEKGQNKLVGFFKGAASVLPEIIAGMIASTVGGMVTTIAQMQEATSDLSRSMGGSGARLDQFRDSIVGVQGQTHLAVGEVQALGKSFQAAGIPIDANTKNLQGYLISAGEMVRITGMNTDDAARLTRALKDEGKSAIEVHNAFESMYKTMQLNNLSLAEMNTALATATSLYRGLGNVAGRKIEDISKDVGTLSGIYKALDLNPGNIASAMDFSSFDKRNNMAGFIANQGGAGSYQDVDKMMKNNPAQAAQLALIAGVKHISHVGAGTASESRRLEDLDQRGFNSADIKMFRNSFDRWEAALKPQEKMGKSIDQLANSFIEQRKAEQKAKTVAGLDEALSDYNSNLSEVVKSFGGIAHNLFILASAGLLPAIKWLAGGINHLLEKLVATTNSPIGRVVSGVVGLAMVIATAVQAWGAMTAVIAGAGALWTTIAGAVSGFGIALETATFAAALAGGVTMGVGTVIVGAVVAIAAGIAALVINWGAVSNWLITHIPGAKQLGDVWNVASKGMVEGIGKLFSGGFTFITKTLTLIGNGFASIDSWLLKLTESFNKNELFKFLAVEDPAAKAMGELAKIVLDIYKAVTKWIDEVKKQLTGPEAAKNVAKGALKVVFPAASAAIDMADGISKIVGGNQGVKNGQVNSGTAGFLRGAINQSTFSDNIADQLMKASKLTADLMNSSGKCLTGVQTALEKIGVGSGKWMGMGAADAVQKLSSHPRFMKVDPSDARPGDLRFLGPSGSHPYGHSAIIQPGADGNLAETSDKYRGNLISPNPYGRFPDGNKVNVFRVLPAVPPKPPKSIFDIIKKTPSNSGNLLPGDRDVVPAANAGQTPEAALLAQAVGLLSQVVMNQNDASKRSARANMGSSVSGVDSLLSSKIQLA